MLYDSGSSKVWVEDESCFSCRNPKKFFSEQSDTFTDNHRREVMRYGKGEIFGKDVSDQICLTPSDDNCMDDFRFMAVNDQRQLHGLRSSGLIGMAPPGNQPGTQLFVPSLYRAGAIKDNQYSVFIDVNGQSKILFGGYDLEKYAKPGKQLKWYPLDDNQFWTLKFSDVKVGDKKIRQSVDRMIADTGTSLLLLPDYDYNQIVETALSGLQCNRMHNSLTGCMCNAEDHAKVPDITFKVHGDTFVIPRNEWFSRKDDVCVVKITHHPNNTWILGLNFFTNYYAVFDYEKEALGLVESKNSELNDEIFLQWAARSMSQFRDNMLNMNLSLLI